MAKISVTMLAETQKMRAGIDDVNKRLGTFGKTSSKVGGLVKTAFIGMGAAIVASKFTGFLKDCVAQARESNKVLAQTNAVLKSTGGVAGVTAKQVSDLATSLSLKTGIDDEAIASNENLLLTFTNVRNEVGKGNDIFTQATKTVLDMSAALGQDGKSSAIQLGKALNDPIKGVTALARVGVSFTEQQKAQIATLVKSGDTLKAQKVILGEVTKEFGGSAAAIATPGQKLAVVVGNIKESIGNFLIPILDTLAVYLTKNLPKWINTAGRAFKTIKDKVSPVVDAIKTFFTTGSGHSVVVKVISELHDKAHDLAGYLDAASTKMGQLKDNIEGVDLHNIDTKNLGVNIAHALIDAIGAIAQMSGKITEAMGKAFAKVDWVGLGITAGRYAIPLVLGLAAGILDVDFGNLLKGIGDHWFVILMGIITIAFAPSKFAKPLEELLTKVPFAGKFLAGIVRGLQGVGDKLTGFAGDLMRYFWKGFVDGAELSPQVKIAEAVIKGVKAIPARFKAFMDDLKTLIGVKSLEAFEAMGTKAGKATLELLRFVAGIPGKILAALGVGKMAGLLSGPGREVISGLIESATSRFAGMLSFLKGIGGRVTGALRGAGSWLVGVGKALIQGMINGVESMVSSLMSKVGSIASGAINKVKSMFGIHSPSRVFHEIGVNLIKGLINGADEAKSKAKDAFGKVADDILKVYNKRFKNDKVAKEHADAAIASLKGEEAAVLRVAKRHDELADKLSKAKDKYKELAQTARDYAKTIKESVVSFADITSLGGRTDADGNAIAPTASTMIADLGAKVQQAQKFASDIKALIAAGLNKTSLQQILAAGVDAGLPIAEALLHGGNSAISQVNLLTVALDQIASDLGTSASDSMYSAGLKAADGLVKGLQDKMKDLKSVAVDMANALIKAIKKALGIKSPSREMAKVGKFAIAGLAAGLADTAPITKAMNDVAAVMTQPQAVASPAASGGNTYHITIESGIVNDPVQQAKQLQAVIQKGQAAGVRILA